MDIKAKDIVNYIKNGLKYLDDYIEYDYKSASSTYKSLLSEHEILESKLNNIHDGWSNAFKRYSAESKVIESSLKINEILLYMKNNGIEVSQ